MQNRTLLAAIATAAVVAIAAPSASNAQVPQESKGEVAMKPSYSSLMTAINSASVQNEKLKAMKEINAANVQLVDVEPLLKGNDVEAVNAALKKNEADVTALRTALGENESLKAALSASAPAVTPADVIATEIGPDGKVFVYYWKKPS